MGQEKGVMRGGWKMLEKHLQAGAVKEFPHGQLPRTTEVERRRTPRLPSTMRSRRQTGDMSTMAHDETSFMIRSKSMSVGELEDFSDMDGVERGWAESTCRAKTWGSRARVSADSLSRASHSSSDLSLNTKHTSPNSLSHPFLGRRADTTVELGAS